MERGTGKETETGTRRAAKGTITRAWDRNRRTKIGRGRQEQGEMDRDRKYKQGLGQMDRNRKGTEEQQYKDRNRDRVTQTITEVQS